MQNIKNLVLVAILKRNNIFPNVTLKLQVCLCFSTLNKIVLIFNKSVKFWSRDCFCETKFFLAAILKRNFVFNCSLVVYL